MHFRYNDDIELLSNTIPKNTKYLEFGNNFNQCGHASTVNNIFKI